MSELWNRQNKVIFFFVLLICILFTSKGIIIYNEEILVVLTFFGFVFFVSRSYGGEFGATLDVRSVESSEHLRSFFDSKKQLLKIGIEEQTKQLQVSDTLKRLSLFSIEEMNFLVREQTISFRSSRPNLVKNKLTSLSVYAALINQKWNESLALSFFDGVLEQYVSSRKNLRLQLYSDAVSQLKTFS